MALCHTGDVERIIEEYEEEMKSRKEQWNAIFSQYAAAEGKKKKEEPLQRGRFVVAEVNFAGSDGMSLLETVCAVISVNKERITVLAHLPNVTPSLLPQAQLLSVPEDAVIIFTPRVDVYSAVGRYIRVNNEVMFVATLTTTVGAARAREA